MDGYACLALDPLHQRREEQVQLYGRLEGGLQANLHHPGRRVENLRGLDFLLARNLIKKCQLDSLFQKISKIFLIYVIITIFVRLSSFLVNYQS